MIALYLPSADTRKHALENEHLAWRETDRVRETYVKSCAPKETLIVKMSKRMKGSLPYLQILAKSKLKLQKILIENVTESVITAIYECCLNTFVQFT